jgi:anti-sigma factor RsiW
MPLFQRVPCHARPQIVLLAANNLSADDLEAARQHLSRCAECRSYFQDISRLLAETSQLAETLPSGEPSPAFHAKLMARIENSQRPQFFVLAVTAIGQRLRLRPEFVLAGLVLVAILVWISIRGDREPSRIGASTPTALAPAARASAGVPRAKPSLWNYHAAADASASAFEEFLTAQWQTQPPVFQSVTMDALMRSEND